MNQKNILIQAIVFLILFCSSCSNTMSNGEPIDANLPIPEPGKAMIYGVLLDEVNKKPISGNPFLGNALTTNNPELPITVSFSLQNDPGAVYDIDSGFFYFDNIEPGSMYVIVLVYGPGNLVVVEDPSTQLPLIISINAGDILDLGTIYIKE